MKKLAVVLVSVSLLSGCVLPVTEQKDSELCFNLGRAESEGMRSAILQEMGERVDAGMFPLTHEQCKKQYLRGKAARTDSIIPAWTVMQHSE